MKNVYCIIFFCFSIIVANAQEKVMDARDLFDLRTMSFSEASNRLNSINSRWKYRGKEYLNLPVAKGNYYTWYFDSNGSDIRVVLLNTDTHIIVYLSSTSNLYFSVKENNKRACSCNGYVDDNQYLTFNYSNHTVKMNYETPSNGKNQYRIILMP